MTTKGWTVMKKVSQVGNRVANAISIRTADSETPAAITMESMILLTVISTGRVPTSMRQR